jgi:HAT1-interacting factor 1
MSDPAPSHEQAPTTALEAAVAPLEIDVPDTMTTGMASLADDIAAAASTAASSVAPTPGTATPFELDDNQRRSSLKVSLADICARAAALYAHKSYEEAAEVYAQAAEMQAEMNGEMNPENSEILFLYGRALFRVGQSKSDVLGGKAPASGDVKKGTKGKKPSGSDAAKKTAETGETGVSSAAAATASNADKTVRGDASGAKKTEELVPAKPLFQFSGDENFDMSDDEEAVSSELELQGERVANLSEQGDEGEGEDDEEEEDDDLAVAFEVLDLARVLFEKRLGAEQTEPDDKGKGVPQEDSPTIRHIKERLADTHDLLAEISLENERYLKTAVS